jgi:hypothetical protein
LDTFGFADHLPGENWMVDRLTVPQLLAKLKAEKSKNIEMVETR